MKPLKILVLCSSLDKEKFYFITSSLLGVLKYSLSYTDFIEKKKLLSDNLVLEDVSANTKSILIDSTYGYVLTIGKDQENKIPNNIRDNLFIKSLPETKDWKEFRDTILKTLETFISAWLSFTVEKKLAQRTIKIQEDISIIIPEISLDSLSIWLNIKLSNNIIPVLCINLEDEPSLILKDLSKKLEDKHKPSVIIVSNIKNKDLYDRALESGFLNSMILTVNETLGIVKLIRNKISKVMLILE